MKLKELQTNFADHLYNKNNKICAVISPSKISPENRLQVYRNNVFGNFDGVLESIFEVTKKIIGEEEFEKLAKKYHQKYYSQSGDLNDYGEFFPKVFSTKILKELAELEWLFHRSYFAPDRTKIDLKKLQNLNEEKFFKLKFKLHPSCHLLASNYPIYRIWKNHKKKTGKKEFILIERALDNCQIHNLSEVEFQFLKQIEEGKNIYKIYQKMAKQNHQFDIGTLINKYVSIGILSDFRIEK